MKFIGLFFTFFFVFIALNGFCFGSKDKVQDNAKDTEIASLKTQLIASESKIGNLQNELENIKRQPPPQVQVQPTVTGRDHPLPITREIISLVLEADKDPAELAYHLSMPLSLITNRRNNNVQINDGKLIFNEQNISETIDLTVDDRGKLNSPITSEYESSIKIFFEEKNVILTFKNLMHQNLFVLFSAESGGSDYSFRFEGTVPYLCIYYDYVNSSDSVIKVQGISGALPRPVSRDPDGGLQSVKNITGNGLLSKDAVVAFIVSKGNQALDSQQIESLIDTYIVESQKENINHDIAIAQMCYATNYLASSGNLSSHNYAGFGSMDGREVKYPNMETGVRAHIQHLKGYASRDKLKERLVDQRFDILEKENMRGTVTNLDELCAKWSPGFEDYKSLITAVLEALYQFSSDRRS